MDSGEQQQKAREGSLKENPEVDNFFTTSMNSPEYLQILFNCLQNVEKVLRRYMKCFESFTQSSQVKGELQLKDLSEAVEFIAKK